MKLLDESLYTMLAHLKRINYHTNYIIKKDRIGYAEGDNYLFNIQKGYLTQFAYLREAGNHGGLISDDAVRKNLGLRVSCGTFSYAKIPEKFKLIMGVTGTLKGIPQY